MFLMDKNIERLNILDQLIIGRVSPHIYAFTTNTIPNYLKIGDTYRSVTKRLDEWKKYYPDLKKVFEEKATVNNDIYFRDYSVHQYLERDIGKNRLKRINHPPNVPYSKEFFKEVESQDIIEAIYDIKRNFKNNSGKYTYYNANENLPIDYKYKRGDSWELRPNQQRAVDSFKKAVLNGRDNLLMYAVMRFGKSFTSLCCSEVIDAKTILIVSAKADVKEEWKKTIETAGNFKGYTYLDALDLTRNENAIKDVTDNNGTAAIFLTLQDLQGSKIKNKHKEIFSSDIDLLIIDETHFGARADKYGQVLKAVKQPMDDKQTLKRTDDQIEVTDADQQIKTLNAKIKLHLSGTPYRILMGNEFEREDIISFVQFSDIVKEQKEWDEMYLVEDDEDEWNNPYFGFPEMVRFAFNPNKSSIEKMNSLKEDGVKFTFSALFEPKSIQLDKNNNLHKKFKNENEILDLLKVIDGSKKDDGLLGFLDYDKLKQGNMCRHMVMVLPYCASCDAMEELIYSPREVFKNLGDFEIINISGVEGSKNYKNPNDVKMKIKQFEKEKKKTITLTVNRMLTGSTVEEWDTMLYFKDTSSPQEYDQAIFRLQNQYTRNLVSGKKIIRENLKPQTLLVDFDPHRLFQMQEKKSLIYNTNIDSQGNSELKKRLEDELQISPIITMNKNKIKMVEPTDILEVISSYNNQRSIFDEIQGIPVDINILSDESIRRVINAQSEFGSKGSLAFDAFEGEGGDLDIDDPKDDGQDEGKGKEQPSVPNINDKDEKKAMEKKVMTYYQRILFFSFLTKNHVTSLNEVINIIDIDDNPRLSKNLGLNKYILKKMNELMNSFMLSSLDYKIQNISKLSNDISVEPLSRTLTSLKKFNRMSESEIITSSNLCDDMVSLIPNHGWKTVIDRKEKIIDIATKSGEYAVAVFKKLTEELNYTIDEVEDLIYSIPTSPIAYEFTRRVYEIIGLNTDNIATKFNAYDLVDEKTNEIVDVGSLLMQGKKFSNITLEENLNTGGNVVKFGAIIGNPPYNISDGGAQASSRPIYQKFVQVAQALEPEYMSFVIPTRWFSGGKGLDEFRNNMLNNNTIKELHDFQTPVDLFPETNNRGGVCYFLSDKNWNSHIVRVVTYLNSEVIADVKRPLKTEGIEILIRDSIAVEVLKKVFNNDFSDSFEEVVSPRKPFGIESNILKTDLFSFDDEHMNDPVRCVAKGRKLGYVEKTLVKNNLNWLNQWKVFVPRANNIGTELNDDNLNAFIAKPNTICTEAYLSIGGDLGLDELSARNIVTYLTTKFARFMHKQGKASQDASRKTYAFVPKQDFSNNSDIDWSVSQNEIDAQLFLKYNLTETEKSYIKESIKNM